MPDKGTRQWCAHVPAGASGLTARCRALEEPVRYELGIGGGVENRVQTGIGCFLGGYSPNDLSCQWRWPSKRDLAGRQLQQQDFESWGVWPGRLQVAGLFPAPLGVAFGRVRVTWIN